MWSPFLNIINSSQKEGEKPNGQKFRIRHHATNLKSALTKFVDVDYSCKPSVPSDSSENIRCVSVMIPSKINLLRLYFFLADSTMSLYDKMVNVQITNGP